MFDDVQKKQIINENIAVIETATTIIRQTQAAISKNNEYKSILYTNGDELVAVVFDILHQILDCDLSTFEDEKNEDFNIKLDDVIFIGEIKGVTSNVRSEYISQLDVHFQSYLDKLEEEGKKENVKALLIMNHQRNKDITNREPIHENQIELAKRNDSLVIETITLLKIYERFLKNELDIHTIKNIFTKEKGLLYLGEEI